MQCNKLTITTKVHWGASKWKTTRDCGGTTEERRQSCVNPPTGNIRSSDEFVALKIDGSKVRSVEVTWVFLILPPSPPRWLFRCQPVQCEPSDRQHATDGRSVRPKRRFWPTAVRPSGCSQFHASPLLCCGASQTKVKKWLWGAGACLDYQRDYRAVQIIVRPGNISKWPSVFGKPSGL